MSLSRKTCTVRRQILKQCSIKSIGFWKGARTTFRGIYMEICPSNIKRNHL